MSGDWRSCPRRHSAPWEACDLCDQPPADRRPTRAARLDVSPFDPADRALRATWGASVRAEPRPHGVTVLACTRCGQETPDHHAGHLAMRDHLTAHHADQTETAA